MAGIASALEASDEREEREVVAERGFTLIELMIVVAILGILLAITIPQYQGYRARANNKVALADVRGLMSEVALVAVE